LERDEQDDEGFRKEPKSDEEAKANLLEDLKDIASSEENVDEEEDTET
jgi:hypothetical protein